MVDIIPLVHTLISFSSFDPVTAAVTNLPPLTLSWSSSTFSFCSLTSPHSAHTSIISRSRIVASHHLCLLPHLHPLFTGHQLSDLFLFQTSLFLLLVSCATWIQENAYPSLHHVFNKIKKKRMKGACQLCTKHIFYGCLVSLSFYYCCQDIDVILE